MVYTKPETMGILNKTDREFEDSFKSSSIITTCPSCNFNEYSYTIKMIIEIIIEIAIIIMKTTTTTIIIIIMIIITTTYHYYY